jgi:hypothetical protein
MHAIPNLNAVKYRIIPDKFMRYLQNQLHIFSSSLPRLHTSNAAVINWPKIYNILKCGKMTLCGGDSRFSLVAGYALNKSTSFVSFGGVSLCHISCHLSFITKLRGE